MHSHYYSDSKNGKRQVWVALGVGAGTGVLVALASGAPWSVAALAGGASAMGLVLAGAGLGAMLGRLHARWRRRRLERLADRAWRRSRAWQAQEATQWQARDRWGIRLALLALRAPDLSEDVEGEVHAICDELIRERNQARRRREGVRP